MNSCPIRRSIIQSFYYSSSIFAIPNFIFLFYRYYYFNVYLFTYKPDVNIGQAGETKETKFFGRPEGAKRPRSDEGEAQGRHLNFFLGPIFFYISPCHRTIEKLKKTLYVW